MSGLAVLSVASEAYPLVKTGGLADVAGALPPALARHGIAATTLLPGYPAVMAALHGAEPVLQMFDLQGGPARLLAGRARGLDLFVLDAPHLYDRPGDPYRGPDGRDWPDNAQRFAALGRAAALLGQGAVPGFRPGVVHAHDWQAGLAPAYLHYGGARPGTVMTVHNLAFQGRFPADLLPALGLPPESFTVEGVEYYGGIGFLKAGLRLADRITTVSPSYAAEIRTPEGGMGLDGLLRARGADLSGILNGIDTAVWDPAADPALASTFRAGAVKGRAANKAALQAALGLAPRPDALLFGVISRLTWQKGMDLLLEVLPTALQADLRFVGIGSGDGRLEDGLRELQARHPKQMAVHIGFDPGLSHLVEAGADFFLMPSRYEPCGLNQMYSLRYGTVPIVRATGGLVDTVEGGLDGTGLLFEAFHPAALLAAFRRALALYAEPPRLEEFRRRGMEKDFSWDASARKYEALYTALMAE